jgi:hypothetical protein
VNDEYTPAATEELDTGFPWPPAEGESAVSAFGRTWQGSSLAPRSFFRAMPASGSLGAALLYYLPVGMAVAGASLFWSVVRRTDAGTREAVLDRSGSVTGLSPLMDFLFAPAVLLLSLFVSAAITHLLLRLLGGASRDLRFTTRVFAFSYSPQVLGIIPIVGPVAGFAWMVVVAVIGLKEGHRTSTGRAVAAVMIPVVVALIFVAIAAFLQLTGGVLH